MLPPTPPSPCVAPAPRPPDLTRSLPIALPAHVGGHRRRSREQQRRLRDRHLRARLRLQHRLLLQRHPLHPQPVRGTVRRRRGARHPGHPQVLLRASLQVPRRRRHPQPPPRGQSPSDRLPSPPIRSTNLPRRHPTSAPASGSNSTSSPSCSTSSPTTQTPQPAPT